MHILLGIPRGIMLYKNYFDGWKRNTTNQPRYVVVEVATF